MKTVYVAFPGSGKSTLAKKLPGYIDLDFGMMREAFHLTKESESQLYEPFSRLIRMYSNDGYIVLTNEPGIMPYLKQKNIPMAVVLPNDIRSYIDRVKQRDVDHPVGDGQFAKAYEKHAMSWSNDWARMAQRLQVPVYRARYLEDIM